MHYPVIGDLIDSRAAPDRIGLQARLVAVLAEVNARRLPVRPLRVTVGDEFQGVFGSLTEAMAATLDVRLALISQCDVRHGIGSGVVSVIDPEAGTEDGPGWWSARAAVEEAEALAAARATGSVRTRFCGSEAEIVNAALNCRDHLVGSMTEPSRRILSALREGHSQSQAAVELGISASAVSQRVRRDGIGVIVLGERSHR